MFLLFYVGGNLLSHNLPVAVPSARAGLASGFGMGPGVSLSLLTTDKLSGQQNFCVLVFRCCVRYCIVDATHTIMCIFVCLLASQVHPTIIPTRGVWVVVVCLFWSISTSSLHTLQCFQVWPIYPIVFRGPQKKPHLKTGFPLRCFQRLSLPYVANQRCSWRNNWHTRGTSVPVLSY